MEQVFSPVAEMLDSQVQLLGLSPSSGFRVQLPVMQLAHGWAPATRSCGKPGLSCWLPAAAPWSLWAFEE